MSTSSTDRPEPNSSIRPVRQSTRKPKLDSVVDSHVESEQVSLLNVSGQLDRVKDFFSKDDNSEDLGVLKGRAEHYGAEREVSRYTAPMQFCMAIFVALCISYFAFGLLRGNVVDTSSATSGYEQDSAGGEIINRTKNTSTNTGILRGGN